MVMRKTSNGTFYWFPRGFWSRGTWYFVASDGELKWFRSYLTSVTRVVPHPSSRSRVSGNLFLIFINDFLYLPSHIRINAFADDIIFNFNNYINIMIQNIVDDLGLLWCAHSRMQVNVHIKHPHSLQRFQMPASTSLAYRWMHQDELQLRGGS